MTNLSKFFNKSNIPDEEPEKNKDQARFEAELIDKIPLLVSVIEQAHENMLSEISGKHPDYLNHLSKANRMHEQIKGLLYDTFGSQVKRLKYNRHGLFIGNFVMLFKKLDNAGMPSNISTGNSEMIITQGKLNFPGQPIVVHVGYVVGRNWDDIKRIFAVGIKEKSVEWISNLRELSNGSGNAGMSVVTNTPPTAPTTLTDDVVVKPKQKQKKASNGS